MNKKGVVQLGKSVLVLGACVISVTQQSAFAQANAVRNAAAEFTSSTPPADWAYMERTGAGCVTPGAAITSPYNPVPGASGYINGPIPIVAKNNNPTSAVFSSANIDAGKMWMHPGTKGECAVVRFKAPAAGTYIVDVTLKAADTASPNIVRAYVFGSGAPGAVVGGAETLNAFGSYGATKSFSRTVSVKGKNRFIDLAIDDGANPDPLGSFRFDSTQVDIIICRVGGPIGKGKGGDGSEGCRGKLSIGASTLKP